MANQAEDETREIQTKYDEFQKACKTILPKIDRKLVEDFVFRQHEDPGTNPMYNLEVTTKEGLDTQKIKDLIWSKLGEMPDIDHRGTYYRIEHKITLGMLKRISEHDFVLNVKGSYKGPYYF
jgi:hypothetical protein